MITGIFPGSFDPVTYGHIDLIARAARLTEKLVVGVLNNTTKKPLFTAEERVEMLREAIADIPNVEVRYFSGLTVNFAEEEHASVIFRGLRDGSDYDYECRIASANKKIAPQIETVFLQAENDLCCISSTVVKEIAACGGDIGEFVPGFTADRIYAKLKSEG